MIARPPRVNPLEYARVLTVAELRDQLDDIGWRGIQPEVQQWAMALLTLQLRAISRWWDRGASQQEAACGARWRGCGSPPSGLMTPGRPSHRM